MTSSKFPLYLTDKDWIHVLRVIEIAFPDLPGGYPQPEAKVVYEILRSQLEKLGIDLKNLQGLKVRPKIDPVQMANILAMKYGDL